MHCITPPTNRAKVEPLDKTNAGNQHKYRLSAFLSVIQTPYRLSYFLCLSSFLLSETASSRLFLFIIFSFQNFRYHSGIISSVIHIQKIYTSHHSINHYYCKDLATATAPADYLTSLASGTLMNFL